MSLLESALEITQVSGWAKSRLYVPPYQWLSPSELLFFRGDSEAQASDPRQVMRYQIETQQNQPLPDLSHLFHHTHGALGEPQASPDGTRLLWTGILEDQVFWMAAPLDGTELYAWPRRRFRRHEYHHFDRCSWMEDSRRCLVAHFDWESHQVGWVVRSWIRSLSPNEEAVSLPILELGNLTFDWYMTILSGSLLIIAAKSDDTPANTREISAWNLETGVPLFQHQAVVFPEEANIVALTYSPQSQRLAWEITTAPMGPDSWVYKPLRSKQRPKEPTFLQVWTSALDGSHLALAGQIPYQPGKENYQYQYFGGLSWLPDGERLSFVFHPSLYVLPVARPAR